MKDKICKISLFSGILACVAAMPTADAAMKTKNSNRSYAGAYQQVNALRYAQEYANENAITADTLPVTVDDQNLAQAIANNESDAPDVSKLESCAMIYPNGVFKWASPESGRLANSGPQCVAVIELRDANANTVLATTTVAAGDSIKCNVDSFPSYGMSSDLKNGKIEVPADAAPTMEDVEAVMNAEQKQNAGLKIAAAALLSGVAGNLLSKKEAGKSTGKIPLGTGETQLKNTALGAVAGAGIMAASTYSGKVAGDTIKSTAVNAASGMVIGNMLAGTSGGNGVLATTKCAVGNEQSSTEHDCILGNFAQKGNEFIIDNNKHYIVSLARDIKECEMDKNAKWDCHPFTTTLMDIVIKTNGNSNVGDTALKDLKDSDYAHMIRWQQQDDGYWEKANRDIRDGGQIYYEIRSAFEQKSSEHAYAVFSNGTLNKKTGYQTKDWEDTLKSQAKIYARNHDGSVGHVIENPQSGTFTPLMRDASSGGLVDLSNEGRIKGTVAGTAVGGALGGIAGYSGAKDEVSQRWLAAKDEYENSLSNFVCVTGGRYLSKYNDRAEIPALTVTEQQE